MCVYMLWWMYIWDTHSSISVHTGMQSCVGESIRAQKRGAHKRQEEKEWKRDLGGGSGWVDGWVGGTIPNYSLLCSFSFTDFYRLGSHTGGMYRLRAWKRASRSACVSVPCHALKFLILPNLYLLSHSTHLCPPAVQPPKNPHARNQICPLGMRYIFSIFSLTSQSFCWLVKYLTDVHPLPVNLFIL